MWGLYLKEERYALSKNRLLVYTSPFQGCSMYLLCLFGTEKAPPKKDEALSEGGEVCLALISFPIIYDAALG